jgi:hypothetical protein
MNTADIDRARAVVRAADESPARARLLKFLDHCETLFKGTMTVLEAVGQSAGGVTHFHDALVTAHEQLKKVHDVLLDLEVMVVNLCIVREVPYDLGDAVRAVIRAQSRELNDLLWALPTLSRRTAGPPEI